MAQRETIFILSLSHLEPQLWINCVLESEAISSAPQALNWHWPSRRTPAKCLLMWRKNISHIYLTKRTRNRQKDAFPVALIVSAVSLAKILPSKGFQRTNWTKNWDCFLLLYEKRTEVTYKRLLSRTYGMGSQNIWKKTAPLTLAMTLNLQVQRMCSGRFS